MVSYMSSVKVIDLNEEATKEEEPKQIEEARQSPATYREAPQEEVEITNETTEEVKEEEKQEEVKEVAKPTPKEKAKAKAKTKVQCNTCDKSMTYKNFRYYHDDHCSEDKIEYKPIKKQANPKGKAKPKPKPVPVYDEEEEEQQPRLSTPVQKQVFKPQPSNPISSLQQHYQLLQNEYIKQKQDKYNTLCQNMFSSKSKKR